MYFQNPRERGGHACLVPPADAHALIKSCSTTPKFWSINPNAGISSKRKGEIELHHNIMNSKNGIYFSWSWKPLIHPKR
jgi:hypothetical protein